MNSLESARKAVFEKTIKIGDVVQIAENIPSRGIMDIFPGTAVYMGTDQYNPTGCIALKRHDGIKGGAQDYLWSFNKKGIPYLIKVGKEETP